MDRNSSPRGKMFRVMIFIPNRKIVSKYKNMQLQERIKKKTISFPCSIASADVKSRLTLLRALNFRSELRATAAIAKDNTHKRKSKRSLVRQIIEELRRQKHASDSALTKITFVFKESSADSKDREP